MTEIKRIPEVAVHIWGGYQRLTVKILMANFEGLHSNINNRDLADCYKDNLAAYLFYLRNSEADDRPLTAEAKIMQHWTDCDVFRIRSAEVGMSISMTGPRLPEPELSSGIWRTLLRDDFVQILEEFDRLYVPSFYDDRIAVRHYYH